MRSLFILSLPRSLSSQTYEWVRRSTRLKTPRWCTDGEFLNVDRYVHLAEGSDDSGLKLMRPDVHAIKFREMYTFAEEIVREEGYVYKDVVQPYLMRSFLQKNDFPVLKIKRSLADVAWSMQRKNWYYPSQLSENTSGLEALIRGLATMRDCLQSIPGETITFEEILRDERRLYHKLSQLYPYENLKWVRYMDAEFKAQRKVILERRAQTSYGEIMGMIRDLGLQP